MTRAATPRFGFTIMEVVVLLAIAAMLALLFSQQATFAMPWFCGLMALASIVLAVYSYVEKRNTTALSLLALSVALIVAAYPSLSDMRPLDHKVPHLPPQSLTVAEAFHHLAKSKTERPYWRFHIATSELADREIHIEVPDGSRLKDAMGAIAIAADVSYTWNWHLAGGGKPLCASFYLSNDRSIEHNDFTVLVHRDEIYDSTKPE